jgi:hypothetical protein
MIRASRTESLCHPHHRLQISDGSDSQRGRLDGLAAIGRQCGAFSAYLQEIAGVMEHAARVAPMRAYCSGLLLDCERKSVEPIAAATAPGGTSAQHQSLLHFLAKGEWSDEKVLGKVRGLVLPQIERIVMMRWRIERDYQELKQEVGLGHFEGRSWRGFHHHATMCIAAYGFWSPKGAFPPRRLAPDTKSRNLPFPKVTDPEAPRSGLSATSPLDRNPPTAPQRRPPRPPAALPLLCQADAHKPSTAELMTQYD